jgi:hypothetical protein
MDAVFPVSTAAAARLLGLILLLPWMSAHAHTHLEPSMDASAALETTPVLTELERFEWIARARADLAAFTAGPGTDADRQHRGFLRAFGESDPAYREALLHIWLSEYIGPAPTDEPNAARFRRLLDSEPVVRVEHHDHPEHAVPAFNIAGLTRNRIGEQRIRIRGRELALEPASIPAALLSTHDPTEFRAALHALETVDPAIRSALFADPNRSFLKRPAGAEATLALAERGWLPADALVPLIEEADPEIALRAFRQSRSHDAPLRTLALDRALERPDLGGLPIADAAQHTDPKLREAVWDLLDEPQRGADAALALARYADDLEARIDAGFDDAEPRARLRMLLALRLRSTPSSRAFLQQLRTQRLSSAEVRATEAWQ